jgi:hypothetical protein
MTILYPEVQYPKLAIPYGTLPDELLHYWQRVLAQEVRDLCPLPLLDTLHWQPHHTWIAVVTCLPASRGHMSSTGRTFMYLPLPRQEVELLPIA